MKRIIPAILTLLILSVAVVAAAKDEEIVTKGDSPKMREAYEYFVLEEKNPAFALNNEGNFLSIKGRYEEALDKYGRALAIAPNDTLILNNYAWTLILAGRYSESLEPLKKSAALDPKKPSTNFYLGVAYYLSGDHKSAEKYLRVSTTLDPSHPYSHYYLSKVHLKEGDLTDALTEGELAALILGNVWNPDVALYLGDLYARAEMFQKALLQYQKLVDDKDYAYEAHYGLGIVYGSFGDFEKAEEHLTVALGLADDDPQVYYALGKLYSQRDDKLKKALGYAEKALKYEPDNGRFLYLVGWILYRMDNKEEALGYMKKALVADPENGTYRYQVKVLENEITGKDRK
jgi:tetratricopeptide (TPR) repeat protein